MTCLFPKRTDSEVFFHHEIDVTELLKYIKEKNSHNPEYKITIFHCFLTMFARLLLIFIARIVRWLDYWGKVPKSLTEGDTDYSTILVSNLGSIKLPSADHHLNNYGTNSIMITLGTIHKSQVVLPDGSVEIRDFIDLGTTVDERIADGFYFAQSFKLLNYLCQHPEFLDKPLEEESNYDYKS